jgi:hypothetical protein
MRSRRPFFELKSVDRDSRRLVLESEGRIVSNEAIEHAPEAVA